MALGGLPGGVELDEFGRDLLDGLACPGFAFRPVGATHLVQGGGLGADVAGQLVELVHRHEQPVAGLAAFAGGVLDDEVVADRALDGALHQLHEPPDPVDLVNDRVTCLEFEGLDGVSAARRQFPLAAFRALLARQFGGGQQFEFRGSRTPAAPEGPDDHVRTPGIGFGFEAGDPRSDVVFGQQFGHAVCQALALYADQEPPAVAEPGLDVGDGGVHVAAEIVGGGDPEPPGVHGTGVEVRIGRLLRGERAEAPPLVPQRHGAFPDLAEGPVGGGTQVDG